MKSSFLLSLASSTGMFTASSSRRVRAFSTLISHKHHHKKQLAPILSTPSRFPTFFQSQQQTHPHRFYATRRNNDDDTSSLGFFKVKQSARKWVPFMFQGNRKKDKSLQQQQRRNDMEQGIQSLFRDAPFPIRMMGGMIGKMASSLVQQAASQQEQVQDYYQQAIVAIQNDRTLQKEFGTIQVGPPFSQSSSSSSMNGRTRTTIEIGFPVQGSASQQRGVGRLVVTTQNDTTVQQDLQVQVKGRWIRVDTTTSTTTKNRFKASSNDDVMEAEIVTEKEK